MFSLQETTNDHNQVREFQSLSALIELNNGDDKKPLT